MKVSRLFGRPSKNEGADLTIDSHRLLVQAGFIRESVAGRYYMLPLGMRVQAKMLKIIKQHMDAAGGQEILTPVLHPLELWKETNRTNSAGFELMTVTDRRGGDFALGGTAEEMIVDLSRKFNISYKDLPFNIYQFSLKFRDELRARGGLLRVREFIMKDAYSFSTEDQFEAEYQKMWDAYTKIYAEMGIEAEVTEASNGYIGGEYSHEFVAVTDAGETRYFHEEGSDYSAHEDVCRLTFDPVNADQEPKPMEPVEAKRGTSMEDGAKVHGLALEAQIKDVLYFDETNDQYLLAVIRGDLDVNEDKLERLVKSYSYRPATEEEIRDDLGSEPGFISPVGFAKKGKNTGRKVVVIADPSLRGVTNAYGGANELHRDIFNINIDRDYQPDIESDIALAQPGLKGPNGGELSEKRGIEVGNIFQLGFHYTDLMEGSVYTDEAGERQKFYMGCYGIGVGRTLAAIAELHRDDNGIIWPASVAPFDVALVTIAREQTDDAYVASQKLYDELTAEGVDVLWDERMDVRPGEKFADADLIGIPHRVVVSERTVGAEQVEYKQRSAADAEMISPEELRAKLV